MDMNTNSPTQSRTPKKAGNTTNPNPSTRFRRQNFSVKETSLLLQLLKEAQQLTTKRPDPSGNFTPDDWREVHPKYNEQCGSTKRSEDELRARYKTVKKNFGVCKELAERSGWSWSYVDGLPVAPSREAWLERIKANNKYKGYQRRTFPWYKEMEELCGKNNLTFNLDTINESDSSESRRANEEPDGFELNFTPLQEFDQNENNYDSTANPHDNIIPPINIPCEQIEPSDGNQSQTEPQIEPRATSARKRRVEAKGGESSKNKWNRLNVTKNENLLQKMIEQNDRFIEQEKARNTMLSQFVASRLDRPDPNEICREVVSRLKLNGVNLGPNELTSLVVILANPWIRAVFMNIEGNQLKDWIAYMLAPSNLISRRMMTMDIDSDIRPSDDEARFIAEMMDDDHIYGRLRNKNMLMLSLMSSFSNCPMKNNSQKKSRRN